MANIAERIKEERERLELSQEKFGRIAGVSKQTVIAWEKGSTSPTVAQLAGMSAQGLDGFYVLTGEHKNIYKISASADAAYSILDPAKQTYTLGHGEEVVVNCMRKLTCANQDMLRGIAQSMLKTQELRDAMQELNGRRKAKDEANWWPEK